MDNEEKSLPDLVLDILNINPEHMMFGIIEYSYGNDTYLENRLRRIIIPGENPMKLIQPLHNAFLSVLSRVRDAVNRLLVQISQNKDKCGLLVTLSPTEEEKEEFASHIMSLQRKYVDAFLENPLLSVLSRPDKFLTITTIEEKPSVVLHRKKGFWMDILLKIQKEIHAS